MAELFLPVDGESAPPVPVTIEPLAPGEILTLPSGEMIPMADPNTGPNEDEMEPLVIIPDDSIEDVKPVLRDVKPVMKKEMTNSTSVKRSSTPVVFEVLDSDDESDTPGAPRTNTSKKEQTISSKSNASSNTVQKEPDSGKKTAQNVGGVPRQTPDNKKSSTLTSTNRTPTAVQTNKKTAADNASKGQTTAMCCVPSCNKKKFKTKMEAFVHWNIVHDFNARCFTCRDCTSVKSWPREPFIGHINHAHKRPYTSLLDQIDKKFIDPKDVAPPNGYENWCNEKIYPKRNGHIDVIWKPEGMKCPVVKCSLKDHTFTDKNEFNEHWNHVHRVETDHYVCKHCNKGAIFQTKYKTTLIKHVEKNHMGREIHDSLDNHVYVELNRNLEYIDPYPYTMKKQKTLPLNLDSPRREPAKDTRTAASENRNDTASTENTSPSTNEATNSSTGTTTSWTDDSWKRPTRQSFEKAKLNITAINKELEAPIKSGYTEKPRITYKTVRKTSSTTPSSDSSTINPKKEQIASPAQNQASPANSTAQASSPKMSIIQAAASAPMQCGPVAESPSVVPSRACMPNDIFLNTQTNWYIQWKSYGVTCPVKKCGNVKLHFRREVLKHWQDVHTGSGVIYECPGCTPEELYTSNRLGQIFSHIREQHVGDMPEKLRDREINKMLAQVKLKQNQNVEFVDPSPFQLLITQESLKDPSINDTTICPASSCDTTVESYELLTTHWKERHVPTVIHFPCPLCGKPVKSLSILQSHLESDCPMRVLVDETDIPTLVNNTKECVMQNEEFKYPGNFSGVGGIIESVQIAVSETKAAEARQEIVGVKFRWTLRSLPSGAYMIEIVGQLPTGHQHKKAFKFSDNMPCPVKACLVPLKNVSVFREHWLDKHCPFSLHYDCPVSDKCKGKFKMSNGLQAHLKYTHNTAWSSDSLAEHIKKATACYFLNDAYVEPTILPPESLPADETHESQNDDGALDDNVASSVKPSANNDDDDDFIDDMDCDDTEEDEDYHPKRTVKKKPRKTRSLRSIDQRPNYTDQPSDNDEDLPSDYAQDQDLPSDDGEPGLPSDDGDSDVGPDNGKSDSPAAKTSSTAPDIKQECFESEEGGQKKDAAETSPSALGAGTSPSALDKTRLLPVKVPPGFVIAKIEEVSFKAGVCPVRDCKCTISFKFYKDFETHWELVHLEECEQYVCPLCPPDKPTLFRQALFVKDFQVHLRTKQHFGKPVTKSTLTSFVRKMKQTMLPNRNYVPPVVPLSRVIHSATPSVFSNGNSASPVTQSTFDANGAFTPGAPTGARLTRSGASTPNSANNSAPSPSVGARSGTPVSSAVPSAETGAGNIKLEPGVMSTTAQDFQSNVSNTPRASPGPTPSNSAADSNPNVGRTARKRTAAPAPSSVAQVAPPSSGAVTVKRTARKSTAKPQESAAKVIRTTSVSPSPRSRHSASSSTEGSVSSADVKPVVNKTPEGTPPARQKPLKVGKADIKAQVDLEPIPAWYRVLTDEEGVLVPLGKCPIKDCTETVTENMKRHWEIFHKPSSQYICCPLCPAHSRFSIRSTVDINSLNRHITNTHQKPDSPSTLITDTLSKILRVKMKNPKYIRPLVLAKDFPTLKTEAQLDEAEKTEKILPSNKESSKSASSSTNSTKVATSKESAKTQTSKESAKTPTFKESAKTLSASPAPVAKKDQRKVQQDEEPQKKKKTAPQAAATPETSENPKDERKPISKHYPNLVGYERIVERNGKKYYLVRKEDIIFVSGVPCPVQDCTKTFSDIRGPPMHWVYKHAKDAVTYLCPYCPSGSEAVLQSNNKNSAKYQIHLKAKHGATKKTMNKFMLKFREKSRFIEPLVPVEPEKKFDLKNRKPTPEKKSASKKRKLSEEKEEPSSKKKKVEEKEPSPKKKNLVEQVKRKAGRPPKKAEAQAASKKKTDEAEASSDDEASSETEIRADEEKKANEVQVVKTPERSKVKKGDAEKDKRKTLEKGKGTPQASEKGVKTTPAEKKLKKSQYDEMVVIHNMTEREIQEARDKVRRKIRVDPIDAIPGIPKDILHFDPKMNMPRSEAGLKAYVAWLKNVQQAVISAEASAAKRLKFWKENPEDVYQQQSLSDDVSSSLLNNSLCFVSGDVPICEIQFDSPKREISKTAFQIACSKTKETIEIEKINTCDVPSSTSKALDSCMPPKTSLPKFSCSDMSSMPKVTDVLDKVKVTSDKDASSTNDLANEQDSSSSRSSPSKPHLPAMNESSNQGAQEPQEPMECNDDLDTTLEMSGETELEGADTSNTSNDAILDDAGDSVTADTAVGDTGVDCVSQDSIISANTEAQDVEPSAVSVTSGTVPSQAPDADKSIGEENSAVLEVLNTTTDDDTEIEDMDTSLAEEQEPKTSSDGNNNGKAEDTDDDVPSVLTARRVSKSGLVWSEDELSDGSENPEKTTQGSMSSKIDSKECDVDLNSDDAAGSQFGTGKMDTSVSDTGKMDTSVTDTMLTKLNGIASSDVDTDKNVSNSSDVENKGPSLAAPSTERNVFETMATTMISPPTKPKNCSSH